MTVSKNWLKEYPEMTFDEVRLLLEHYKKEKKAAKKAKKTASPIVSSPVQSPPTSQTVVDDEDIPF